MLKIVGAFLSTEHRYERADGTGESQDSHRGNLTQLCLEFAIRQFDRVDRANISAVSERRSSALDRLLYASDFVLWGANTDPEAIRRVYRIDKSPALRSCWNEGGGGAGVAVADLSHCGDFQAKGAANRGKPLSVQQLVVLQRRHPQPRLRDADRRFWILASRSFSDWRHPLLIVTPETVLGR